MTEINESGFMKEGMIAIRYLANYRGPDGDNKDLIADIADAMHNGFDERDKIGLPSAAAALKRLGAEHPELKQMMSQSFAWASNKGADE